MTRFEFAVCLQRMAARMSMRTLTKDGTKLEFTFGIPGDFAVEQAQEMVDLWTEFQSELKQLGVGSDTFRRTRKTLEIYIATSSS